LRAATSLACLLRDQGRSADAVACLRLIYDRFTDGFDTADLIAAKRLLHQTGGHSFFCWKATNRCLSAVAHILIVLLERLGELVTKQELMARVWPNLFVEPANLSVHVSPLRRARRDGRDGKSIHYQCPWARLLFCSANQVARTYERHAACLLCRI
jgi:hypothetical protein